MKVFGLQGPIYRLARVASRLPAKTSDIAAGRRDALRRFDRARRDGLTAERAASAVGASRASLHRWSQSLEPKSRRPHRVKQKTWTPEACETRGIRLYVLPPKCPQMNGAVERCNGAGRYEFYQTYDLPSSVEALNPILDSFQHLYNHHRPHGALAGQTPAANLARRQANALQPSHMC